MRGMCKVVGCGKPEHSGGFCGPHLHKFKRHGDALFGKSYSVHGDSYSAEYRAWKNMRSRCNLGNTKDFKNYGGRGILVCDEWQKYDNFIADMGRRPSDKHTLERVNNDLGYSKENCVWATRSEQLRNRRNNRYVYLYGKKVVWSDAAKFFGIDPKTFAYRMKRGIKMEGVSNG